MPSSRPSPKRPEIVAMLQSKRRSSSSHLNLVCRTAGERVARPCPTQFLPRIRIFSGVVGSAPITFTSPSSKAHQKSGPFAPPALPGLDAHTTLSDSRQGRRPIRDVEAATPAHDGSPPITRITFPTCCAHYPGGTNGCLCRLLPRSRSLPRLAGRSASALSLSRPSQALLTLRPTGSLSRLKRPLSRGSSPSGYPAEPLVSFQINRQLSGWNLPPLMVRAFGAHGHYLP